MAPHSLRPCAWCCLLGRAGHSSPAALLLTSPRGTCVQEFAGELLALAGPLDPSAIAFDPSSPFGPAQPGSGGSDDLPGSAVGGPSSSGGGRTQGSQHTPGTGADRRSGAGRATRGSGAPAGARGGDGGRTWAAALRLLGDYLVDQSVGVIRAAQFTARRLLAAPEGQAALQRAGPALQPYLAAFQHDAAAGGGFARPVGDAGNSAAGGPARLGCRQLWRCDRPYTAWVCALADAMLSKVGLGLPVGGSGCKVGVRVGRAQKASAGRGSSYPGGGQSPGIPQPALPTRSCTPPQRTHAECAPAPAADARRAIHRAHLLLPHRAGQQPNPGQLPPHGQAEARFCGAAAAARVCRPGCPAWQRRAGIGAGGRHATRAAAAAAPPPKGGPPAAGLPEPPAVPAPGC